MSSSSSSSEEQKHEIEKMASAIEDLLYMKAIKFEYVSQSGERAILSTPFSIIVSKLMADAKSSPQKKMTTMRL